MNTKDMSLTTEMIADGILIKTGQVLDNSNAHEMVSAITSAQVGAARYIIVDMANLEFLSSAGVGSILGTIETVREGGGDIVLCCVPKTVMQVLDILDLTDYLTIVDEIADATAKCGMTCQP